MKKTLLLIQIFFIVFLFDPTLAQVYKDETATIKNRVNDLLERMTLEEKVGQMCQYVGLEHIKSAEKNRTKDSNNDAWGFYKGLSVNDIEKMIIKGEIGSFLHVTTAQETNYLQSLAMKSRLQIPIIFGIDAIHGSGLTYGATIYPSPITLAATWNAKLVKQIAAETAEELRALGLHWTFTPNVDIALDARWGRVGETFGEDPFLVSAMGVATVKGFQNNGSNKVLACAKHLIGGSEPINGLNGSPTDMSERKMREIFLPPYKAVIDAGVSTIMAAHNELNGVPCHSNKYLIEDIIRKEYGFNGFVVSDWMDIERLYNRHRVAKTPEEASYLAVDAGINMHMHGPGFFEHIINLVRKGKLSETRINKIVSPILKLKFELGLFENPFVDVAESNKVLYSLKHRQTALKAARDGIVLLKNDGLLPIKIENYKHILITGPNANNQTILGDWVLSQPEKNITTVVEGFNKIIKEEDRLTYFDCGQSDKHITPSAINKAAKLAKNSDLIIIVVGENPLRYMPGEKTSGENVARSNIKLPGNQIDLVKAIYRTGKPVIAVLVNGRPLGVEWIAENIPAVIESFEPGALGGLAVAEIITGKINPSGKLPLTIPRNVGQIVTTYNYKPSQFIQTYAMSSKKPLYNFGFGLSYTNFAYNNLIIKKSKITIDENTTVSVTVTNIGKIAGDEIVQLYIHDDFSSVTRPVKELKGFKRIHLEPNESKNVEFKITPSLLSFYDLNMNYVIEPGDFTIMVGSSSADKDLLKRKITVK